MDRVRTLSSPLTSQDVKRLVDIGHALDPSITPLILENLVPRQVDVWQSLDLLSPFSEMRSQ